jgi:hypothetical protein
MLHDSFVAKWLRITQKGASKKVSGLTNHWPKVGTNFTERAKFVTALWPLLFLFPNE